MKSYGDRGRTRFLAVLQTGIAFVWCGLVLGLSFIETPLKFNAPGITLALGVGIGRIVFAALNRTELILSVLFLATLVIGPRDMFKRGIFGLILAIVLAQTFWLLPVLDTRTQLLIDGTPAATSYHHLVFMGVETVKVIALLILGIVTMRRSDI